MACGSCRSPTPISLPSPETTYQSVPNQSPHVPPFSLSLSRTHTLSCRPTAAVKNAAGAPWACSVSPFVDATSGGLPGDDGRQGPPPPVPIDRVARCEECFAYISPFGEFSARYVHTRCLYCVRYPHGCAVCQAKLLLCRGRRGRPVIHVSSTHLTGSDVECSRSAVSARAHCRCILSCEETYG